MMKIICGIAGCVATLSAPAGAFMFPSALPPRQLVGNTAMLKSACCSPLGAGKGAGPVAPVAGRRRSGSSSSSSSSILRAGTGKEPEVTVFDAEGGVSWEEYKKQKPDEYQLNKVDEMQCWETDECPVEDEKKFTKAWHIRSAEKNPTTETHFDSEGEWEEESQGAWSKKWYEDVGADDLHVEDGAPEPPSGYNI